MSKALITERLRCKPTGKDDGMTTFDDRDRAFENKFAHDQEIDFKIHARATRLMGLWAAEKLGLKESDAVAYAARLVEANLEHPGSEDVLRSLEADFAQADISVTSRQLHEELDNQLAIARTQVMAG